MTFLVLFDGDQRQQVTPASGNRWPALFLPTEHDPDQLFKSNSRDVEGLASRLNTTATGLRTFLDSIEGQDPHDWVNDLGQQYGRPGVLRSLAELWIERNPEIVEPFLRELRKAF